MGLVMKVNGQESSMKFMKLMKKITKFEYNEFKLNTKLYHKKNIF